MTESHNELEVASENGVVQPASVRLKQTMALLKEEGDRGAKWFYWIAALSLVNTAMVHLGAELHFIVGLGISMIVDVVAAKIAEQNPNAAAVLIGISIAFSIFISLIAFSCGWLSRQRFLWVFGIGMFFYLLDGLLYLLVQDFFSAAFHGFALFSMIKGFNAYRKLNEIEAAVEDTHSEVVELTDELSEPGFESA